MCASTDITSRKIPNWLLCIGLLTGLWVHISDGFIYGVMAAARVMVVLCILFPIFICRIAGAGDIKAIAVLAGLAGFKAACIITVAGLLAAAPVCLLKLLLRKNLKLRLMLFFAYVRQTYITKQITAYYVPERDGYEHTIPFAMFLFLGYWYYIHTGGNI